MDEKDKIINDLRRENAELKKFAVNWVDINDRSPEHDDGYLVLWTSNTNMTFYAIETYYVDFGWEMSSEIIAKYLEDGKKVELLYWADLPKKPDECYEK